jgi:hypothetical protein
MRERNRLQTTLKVIGQGIAKPEQERQHESCPFGRAERRQHPRFEVSAKAVHTIIAVSHRQTDMDETTLMINTTP